MIFAVELERNMAGICIFYIIVHGFYYKQQPYLVILFLANKYLKISLYCTILPLVWLFIQG